MNEKKIIKKLGVYKKSINLLTKFGNVATNQIILIFENGSLFQSYDSIIAIKYLSIYPTIKDNYTSIVYIGKDWNYSTTTGQYRNQFLGENKAETQSKIDNGVYKLITY